MSDPFSLKNKKILVTGASSGIGKCIAHKCSRAGASMIITGRNKERLHDTFNSLDHGEHCQIMADLSKSEEINEVVSRSPVLDGLVCNAGILKTTPVKFIREDDLLHVMQINYFSVVSLVRELLRNKKINKEGSVIFISSVSAFHPKAGNAIYSGSKGAIVSFSKVLALELAPLRVRVNCISPGFIETGILDAGIITKEQLVSNLENYPLGRYGVPDDVAYAAIYLLSDASKWVTGTSLVVDGGVTLK